MSQMPVALPGPTTRSTVLRRATNPAQGRLATGTRRAKETTPKSYSRAVTPASTTVPSRSSATGSNVSSTGGTPKATAFGGVAESRERLARREWPEGAELAHSASARARSMA